MIHIPKVVGLIQVRSGSSRLPNKATLQLGRQRAIEHVIERAMRSKRLAHVVLCTTPLAEDDALVGLAQAAGIGAYRGSEDDVLARFLGAAQVFAADVLVRITGDSPLVEPVLVDAAIEAHLTTGADYTYTPGLPVGAWIEVFDRAALALAYRLAEDPSRSEDVTLFLRRPEVFHVHAFRAPDDYIAPEVVVALNRPEDYAVLGEIFQALDSATRPVELAEAIRYYRKNPRLMALNGIYTPTPSQCNTRLLLERLG